MGDDINNWIDFSVMDPLLWDNRLTENEILLDDFVTDVEGVVNINGQLSNDLDLFWLPEDELHLFDYEEGSFREFCALALEYVVAEQAEDVDE